MGAGQSVCPPGYWAGFIPRYQMLQVRRADMQRLVVPPAAVSTCGLDVGGVVYIRDALSRSFWFTIERSGGVFFLGTGWAEMLRKIDCSCGDELLFKYKGVMTWKVLVFSKRYGSQKFPFRSEDQSDSTTEGSSNGGALVYDHRSGGVVPTSTHQAVVVGYGSASGGALALVSGNRGGGGVHVSPSEPAPLGHILGAGTKEEPIDLDDDSDDVVYNASDRVISLAMREFFDNLANTFDLRVPLYYSTIGRVDLARDFIPLSPEYGAKYVLPVLEEDGYPDSVNVYLNGGAEHISMKFEASPDGSIVLSGGWRDFLMDNFIQEGAAIVLHVECGVDEINIFVYDF